jgi:hypothetical protein
MAETAGGTSALRKKKPAVYRLAQRVWGNDDRQQGLIVAERQTITPPPLFVTLSRPRHPSWRRPAARPQSLLAYSIAAAPAVAAVDSWQARCETVSRGVLAIAKGMVLSGSGCWSAVTRLRCSGFIVFHHMADKAPHCTTSPPVSGFLHRPTNRGKNSTGRQYCQNDTARWRRAAPPALRCGSQAGRSEPPCSSHASSCPLRCTSRAAALTANSAPLAQPTSVKTFHGWLST